MSTKELYLFCLIVYEENNHFLCISKTIINKMSRRKTVNHTGIDRIPNARPNDVYISYTCLKCGHVNKVNIGDRMITLNEAMECEWQCEECGYVHSQYSDLPAEWSSNWNEELLAVDSAANGAFWKAFFRIAVEKPESYWKRCNVCGRVLPFSAFDKHTGWGALNKQLECRSCKGAINAIGNPKRTSEQLREGAARRRLGDILAALDKDAESKIDIADLFDRFESKCFKTGKPLDISDRESWHIDHILPSKYFYPLTKENAALLSREANSNKRDRWPSDFYTPQELVKLSQITGANLELLSSREPILNDNIDVNAAVDKWLDVRNSTDLQKRIKELKKILIDNKLVDKLSESNKTRLGL